MTSLLFESSTLSFFRPQSGHTLPLLLLPILSASHNQSPSLPHCGASSVRQDSAKLRASEAKVAKVSSRSLRRSPPHFTPTTHLFASPKSFGSFTPIPSIPIILTLSPFNARFQIACKIDLIVFAK